MTKQQIKGTTVCKACEKWKNEPIFQGKLKEYFTCKTACEENNKIFRIEFLGNEKAEICRLQLDDDLAKGAGLIGFWNCESEICLQEKDKASKNIKKCDYLFVQTTENEGKFYFVELKGKEDVLDALKQLYCAMLFFEKQGLLPKKQNVMGFVVGATVEKDKKYQTPIFRRYQEILPKLRKHCSQVYQKPVEGGENITLNIKIDKNQVLVEKSIKAFFEKT